MSHSDKPSLMTRIKDKLHLGHHNSTHVPNTNHPDAAYSNDTVDEHRKDVVDGGDRTAYQDLPDQSYTDRALNKLGGNTYGTSSSSSSTLGGSRYSTTDRNISDRNISDRNISDRNISDPNYSSIDRARDKIDQYTHSTPGGFGANANPAYSGAGANPAYSGANTYTGTGTGVPLGGGVGPSAGVGLGGGIGGSYNTSLGSNTLGTGTTGTTGYGRESLTDRAEDRISGRDRSYSSGYDSGYSSSSSPSASMESSLDRAKNIIDNAAQKLQYKAASNPSMTSGASQFSSGMQQVAGQGTSGQLTAGQGQQLTSQQLVSGQGQQLANQQLVSGQPIAGQAWQRGEAYSEVAEGIAMMSVQPVAAVMKKEIIQPVTTYKAETEYVTRERTEPVVREETITKTVPKVEYVEKTHTEPVVTWVKKTHMEPVIENQAVVTTVPKIETVTRSEEIPVTSYRPETHFVRKEAGQFTAGLDKLKAGVQEGISHLTGHSHGQAVDVDASTSSSTLGGSTWNKGTGLNTQPESTTTTTTTTMQ